MFMTTKVSSSESGSATAGISVSVARPRNRKMTSTTSPNAMYSVSSTSLHAVHDRLRPIVDRHNADRARQRRAERSAAAPRRTSLATSTAFDPARRNTATTTVADGTCVAAHPEPHVDAFVLHAVCRLGDIFQIDGRAIALAHDQIARTPRPCSIALAAGAGRSGAAPSNCPAPV